MDYIKVKTAETPLNHTVGLREKHPDHPGGEAYVNGPIVALVANTEEVQTRLAGGLLVETDEPETVPFEGYDSASVDIIIERLTAGSAKGRTIIRQYEAAHKNRKAILAPGAALTEPFDGYDNLTVDEVVAMLSTATPEVKAVIRDYEQAHKNRKTILNAVGV